MYKRNPQKICTELDYEYKAHFRRVPWTDIYDNEDDLIADLERIDVPSNRTPPSNTFKGYDYIYSFAQRVQRGIPLSDKQMEQAKRLALEIKKAISIQE